MFTGSRSLAAGRATRLMLCVATLTWLAGVQCGGGNTSTGPTPPPGTPPGPPGGTVPPGPPLPTPPSAPVVFAGAGDIAYCAALEPARQTARLVEGLGGYFF